MIVAQEKKKTNIIEYVLYMWQVEDMIRACNLDVDIMNQKLVSNYAQPPAVQKQIKDWYESLADMMRRENIQQKGHLQMVKNTVNELYEFHEVLLLHEDHFDYRTLHVQTLPLINEFAQKTKSEPTHEVETCFTALYAWLLMRLQKKTISPETEQAMESFRAFLLALGERYHRYLSGDLEL